MTELIIKKKESIEICHSVVISVINVFSGNFRLYLSREIKSRNNGSVKVHVVQYPFFILYMHTKEY